MFSHNSSSRVASAATESTVSQEVWVGKEVVWSVLPSVAGGVRGKAAACAALSWCSTYPGGHYELWCFGLFKISIFLPGRACGLHCIFSEAFRIVWRNTTKYQGDSKHVWTWRCIGASYIICKNSHIFFCVAMGLGLPNFSGWVSTPEPEPVCLLWSISCCISSDAPQRSMWILDFI